MYIGWSCCCKARRRNCVQVPLADVVDVIRARFCRENGKSLRVATRLPEVLDVAYSLVMNKCEFQARLSSSIASLATLFVFPFYCTWPFSMMN